MGKNIPLRKCLGCDEMLGKKGMLRVVKSKDGDISIDETGKKNGRGAYICNNAECLRKARKARRLEKIFECGIPDSVYDEAERLLNQN